MYNIIKEQEARYKFASKIVTGKVLILSRAKFMAYHSAKILLDAGISEVWNYDTSDEKNIDMRKYYHGNIQFQNFNVDILDEKFDSIISFESVHTIHDLSSSISNFSKLLNEKGVFIISVFNCELNDNYRFLNIKSVEGLTKNQFHIILTNTFPSIIFYSQLLSSKKDILATYLHYCSFMKQLIRNTLRTILLIFDKKSTFYKIRLQKTISKVDKTVEKIYDDLFEQGFEPILFDESHKPRYFIAVCTYNSSQN